MTDNTLYETECLSCGEVIVRDTLTSLQEAKRKHRKTCFNGFEDNF